MAKNTDKYKIYRGYYSKDSGQTWVEYDKYAYVLEEKHSTDCGYENTIIIDTDGVEHELDIEGTISTSSYSKESIFLYLLQVVSLYSPLSNSSN